MNLTDLKQVLDERSSDATDQLTHLRLRGVRAKVAARRRRRIAAWTTCAVVVIAGAIAASGMFAPRVHVVPTPAATPTVDQTFAGFPEYANGAKVTQARFAELPATRIELTIVPTTTDLVVFSRCSGTPAKIFLKATYSVNGHDFSWGGCGGSFRSSGWDSSGVSVGKPATFAMTITGALRGDGDSNVETPLPDAGSFGLAIGERVAYDEYPLPPRPAGTLSPLSPHNAGLPRACTEALCPDTLIFRSDPSDPTRPVRRTVTWQTLHWIDMAAQTPGLLHLRVNGVEIGVGEWWDYTVGGYGISGDGDADWKKQFGLDLHTGDSVTIEIVPEHLTGAWQVVLSPKSA